MNSISIKLLNHASVIIRYKQISLLSDPWYEGTCFWHGWGLQFINPDALSEAIKCSHLWISHFHTDHLHMPTLKKVAQLNSSMIALSNASVNFDTREPLERAGFTNIHPLIERQPTQLAEAFEVTRFPTTGVDNFLVIKVGGFSILNYNDCNLPESAFKRLIRKIGGIDVLLNNFNHAGKLVDSNRSPEQMMQECKRRYQKIVEIVRPRYAIPFASMHRYRSPYSQDQNQSLIPGHEIAKIIPNAIYLAFGDTVYFNGNAPARIEKLSPALQSCLPDQQVYTVTHTSLPVQTGWQDLLIKADLFRRKVQKEFFGFTFWIAPLHIRVEDLRKVLTIQFNKGVFEGTDQTPCHITTHSEALNHWFGYKYGTVDFHIGAHYKINTENKWPLICTMLAGGLAENALSPRSALRLFISPGGWSFFKNRREEILAVLLGLKFNIESRL